MFDLINGIPLHPLVVHAIVVLLPLATLGTIAVALRPSWRVRYGPLVVAAAVISAVLVPVATSRGEALERRVGNPGRHADLGDQLLWFTLPLVVLSTALVVLEWRRSREPARSDPPTSSASSTTSRALVNVVAVLAVVASLAAGVQVYRVGDSGARAAWGDVPAPSTR